MYVGIRTYTRSCINRKETQRKCNNLVNTFRLQTAKRPHASHRNNLYNYISRRTDPFQRQHTYQNGSPMGKTRKLKNERDRHAYVFSIRSMDHFHSDVYVFNYVRYTATCPCQTCKIHSLVPLPLRMPMTLLFPDS